MKKSIVLTVFAVTCTLIAFSQKDNGTTKAFDENTRFVQLGVGFGGAFFDGSIGMPPIQGRYESAITDNISVGGVLAFASSKYKDSYFNWNINYWLLAARGNYHFATSAKLDPYAGASAGYKYVTVSSKGEGIYGVVGSSGLLIGAQVGANYYLSNKFGLWAEAAYGIGYLSVGATIKL